MKQILTAGWLLCVLMTTAWAGGTAPAVTAPNVIQVQNPPTYAGIRLGDVLRRSLQVETDAGDTLETASLPLKGLQRQGVELRQVTVHQQAKAGKTRVTVDFEYQVFASPGQPAQWQLPTETLAFSHGGHVALPAWRFWLMAQLPDRLHPAKPTLIAQHKAPFADTAAAQRGLQGSLLLAAVGLLVLLYRNADGRWLPSWLPMMNGHFARATRTLKGLPATAQGQKQASLVLMQAFHAQFGQHMLASQVEAFVQQQPAFQSLLPQISQFFVQANAVLYGQPAPDAAAYLLQCRQLARQLRACERRL